MAATTAAVVTGGSALYGAYSSKKAADTQAAAGRKAIRTQQQAAAQTRADLQPFTQFGTDLLPQLQQRLSQPTDQLTYANIVNDPLYQALYGEATRNITANQAARGKLGSGDTLVDLTNASLATGANLVQDRFNREQQATQNLFNAAGMGQNAAAGQGGVTQNTANNISGLQTQIGNVNAAGKVGQANAVTSGINQGIGLYDLINGWGAPSTGGTWTRQDTRDFNYIMGQ